MLKITGLGHVGLLSRDPVALAEFYRELFGMEYIGHVPRGDGDQGMAFLSSRRSEENHELVFFQDVRLAHIAFKVASLADLQSWHAAIKARGLPIEMVANHRSSVAFYFRDPEGNLIELYWPTGRDSDHPVIEPFDLD